jgi:hypothetical protein
LLSVSLIPCPVLVSLTSCIDGNPQHKCTFCPAAFFRIDSLKKHLTICSQDQGKQTRVSHLSHAQAYLPSQNGASLPVAPDASLGSHTSVLGGSRSSLERVAQTCSLQPVALRSGLGESRETMAYPPSNQPMALQPDPGSACIANEDGSEVTMQTGSIASFILDCIPHEGTFDDSRSNEDQNGALETCFFPPSELLIGPSIPNIGGLDASHDEENQTQGELQQAKSTNFLASRSDAESSASSTPNVYIISPSSFLFPSLLDIIENLCSPLVSRHKILPSLTSLLVQLFDQDHKPQPKLSRLPTQLEELATREATQTQRRPGASLDTLIGTFRESSTPMNAWRLIHF